MWSMGPNPDLPLASHSELIVSLLVVYLYEIIFFSFKKQTIERKQKDVVVTFMDGIHASKFVEKYNR